MIESGISRNCIACIVGKGYHHIAGAVPHKRNIKIEGDPTVVFLAFIRLESEIGFGKYVGEHAGIEPVAVVGEGGFLGIGHINRHLSCV